MDNPAPTKRLSRSNKDDRFNTLNILDLIHPNLKELYNKILTDVMEDDNLSSFNFPVCKSSLQKDLNLDVCNIYDISNEKIYLNLIWFRILVFKTEWKGKDSFYLCCLPCDDVILNEIFYKYTKRFTEKMARVIENSDIICDAFINKQEKEENKNESESSSINSDNKGESEEEEREEEIELDDQREKFKSKKGVHDLLIENSSNKELNNTILFFFKNQLELLYDYSLTCEIYFNMLYKQRNFKYCSESMKPHLKKRIKLKELKSINSANNFYNTNNNNNNYRTKSYISKSNSSINIYKDNLTEKKENMNLFNNNLNNRITNTNNNSLLNNMHSKKRYNRIKKNNITNPSITLNNLTLSLQNIKKMSNSKTMHKKKYNNSTNYFNKKYINNLTTILFIREPKNKYKKKERNKSLNKNNRNMNKSMLDLFPSRNLNYLLNNNNNNKKYINNNYNINNYNINNNSNKRKKTKSLNITHNTINMNKNSVLINLNANIINTKTPIEKYKVQQKLMEYKKYLNKKLNEFTKKNKKNSQIIPPPSNKNYKKINKYFKKNNNKRKISPIKMFKILN